LRKQIIWSCLLIFVLFSITAIDRIVHYECYRYGLEYDLRWAEPYWNALNLIWVSVALLAGYTYFLGSARSTPSILIFFTVFFQQFNLDFLWFCFGMDFPQPDHLWSWSPFYRYLGIYWTTTCQWVLIALVNMVIATLWSVYVLFTERSKVASLAGFGEGIDGIWQRMRKVAEWIETGARKIRN
jgi:ABC-type phosphate/phosphonate transport system permease subunit